MGEGGLATKAKGVCLAAPNPAPWWGGGKMGGGHVSWSESLFQEELSKNWRGRVLRQEEWQVKAWRFKKYSEAEGRGAVEARSEVSPWLSTCTCTSARDWEPR